MAKRKRLSRERELKASVKDEIPSESHVGAVDKKKVRWESITTTEENTERSESEEDNTVPEKICLTIWCQHGRVGGAYYDPVKCLIYVLEDTQETLHLDLTKMLLEQTNPDVVLTSSRADDDSMDFLRAYMETSEGIFQIRPHKDFAPAKGRDRLLSLHFLSDLPSDGIDLASSNLPLNGESRNAYEFMSRRKDIGDDPTMKRWNASIRLSNFASAETSPLCISSVGALIDYLVRQRALSDLEDEGVGGLDVRHIEALTLDRVMQISSDALQSLQIFEEESHASVHSDKTKEGLSLFGTLNNTKTTLGRSLLRTWLLRPTLSIPVINARHDAVSCFLRSENLGTAELMHANLKGIKNVPRILGVMRIGRAKVSDWKGLVMFTLHSSILRDALTEIQQASGVEIIRKLIDVLDIASFREVGTAINDIIDWEESTNADRVCVKPRVDEELDNRKHVYNGIDTVLSKVAEQICQAIPSSYASSLNVVYFPQLGFLICVPMLEEWRTEEGIQVMDGWSFQFSTDSHVYFKSQEMQDMDTHIGDLHSSIVDQEIEIIQNLLDKILLYDKAMGLACDVCAELDCLLSFAAVSRAFDYRRPCMVEENVIDITGGRHPLHEQVVDTFVSNDARVAGGVGIGSSFSGYEDDDLSKSSDGGFVDWHSVVVCTGANACGKSVYLKQIALIQYMAQIGCFVPAQSATLGVVDKIFTRISTRESVSQAQSAFMIDLNQVSVALRNATPRSLILLDEFGKGTLSTDGAGLFCGVLKHLLNRGPACPKVLVATHFHNVFRHDVLDPESVPITFLHMQVMFTTENGEVIGERNDSLAEQREDGVREVGPGEKITYLYRVARGLSLNSHATKCAEIFGIPQRVLERARWVSRIISTHELGQLLDEEMTEAERLDLEKAEAVCRRFLAWNLQDEMNGHEGELSVKTKLAIVLGE